MLDRVVWGTTPKRIGRQFQCGVVVAWVIGSHDTLMLLGATTDKRATVGMCQKSRLSGFESGPSITWLCLLRIHVVIVGILRHSSSE